MEDELLLALHELIEAVNYLAEPTELDEKFYYISYFSLILSFFAIVYSMYVNYDVNRIQSRVALFQERLTLAKEMELQFNRWELRLSYPTTKMKMPDFPSKELKYLFDESVYDLYNKIVRDYKKTLDNSNISSNDTEIYFILCDIKDNRQELSQKLDDYLEVFREPDKLTFLKIRELLLKEKRMKRIKKRESKNRKKARKTRERLKKQNLKGH